MILIENDKLKITVSICRRDVVGALWTFAPLSVSSSIECSAVPLPRLEKIRNILKRYGPRIFKKITRMALLHLLLVHHVSLLLLPNDRSRPRPWHIWHTTSWNRLTHGPPGSGPTSARPCRSSVGTWGGFGFAPLFHALVLTRRFLPLRAYLQIN